MLCSSLDCRGSTTGQFVGYGPDYPTAPYYYSFHKPCNSLKCEKKLQLVGWREKSLKRANKPSLDFLFGEITTKRRWRELVLTNHRLARLGLSSPHFLGHP
jgi:hypothetical protein